jgi:hypothetical protein
MKKTLFLLLVAFLIIIHLANGQNLIAVQNGGNPTFFLQVNDAIANAQDGDTIYIPGGIWSVSQPINKRLHIIGVGHNPDSTLATFQTTINGNISLTAGASYGSLTGIALQGVIDAYGSPVNNYTVSRCSLSGITFYQVSDIVFIENIISGTYSSYSGGFAANCSFFNNIISMWIPEYGYPPFSNCCFKNNIFLYQTNCWGQCGLYSIYCKYSLIENNIFVGSTSLFYQISNSIVKNNLFVDNLSFPIGTNVGSNNIVNQPQSSIFVNQSGNSFSYGHDYHLQSTCPGKNAGTDGTDVGIYGGIYPWKEGSLPFNPHIQTVQVSPTTSTSGGLNVNIKVAAQDH